MLSSESLLPGNGRHRVVVEPALVPRGGSKGIEIAAMSPELGFVLFITLLWGPTALWLAYRSVRGRQGWIREGFTVEGEQMRSSQVVPDEVEALVGSDEFWACEVCRSLNKREANRCYGCRTPKGSAARQAPEEPPISRWVPVMADGVARHSGEAARATVALATPRIAAPAPEILVRAREHVLAAAPEARAVAAAPPEARAASAAAPEARVLAAAPSEAPEARVLAAATPEVRAFSAATPEVRAFSAAPSVCPYLGFRNDPSSRCDFPDPRNLCHATSERGSASAASPRRFATGTAGARRPQLIGVEHQNARCLTDTHEKCVRYAAVEAVAATG
jgi:hypothetical protein